MEDWKNGMVAERGEAPICTYLLSASLPPYHSRQTLKKIIAEVMYARIKSTEYIAPEQFGVIRGRSTRYAIQSVLKSS